MTASASPARAQTGPRRGFSRKTIATISAWVLVAPALILIVTFVFVPFLSGIPLSMQKWDGFSDPTWVGLKNFSRLFTDPKVHNAFLNNIEFLVIATLGKNIIGLAIALALNQVNRLKGFFRTTVFIPVTLSFVAVGLLWSWIYNPSFGLLNGALDAVGLSSWTHVWLGETSTALYAVIAVEIWKWIGFHAVLYLAALQTVPAEQVEAAVIDGANAFQRFVHVTVPAIVSIIGLNFLLAFSGSFLANFDVVWVMTQGGPNHSSEVLMTYMIDQAFNSGNMGYGAAIGYGLFLIVAVTAGAAIILTRRKD